MTGRPRRTLGMAVGAVAASGMGLGLSPVAPGTLGSLWGVLLVIVVWPMLPHAGAQLLLAAVLALAAVPICEAGERWYGVRDDSRIVADEYLAFPLCMVGLPVRVETVWILVVAFLSFRCFDIVKPPPARGLERLRGGWGIVADDAMAALYALAFNHLVFFAAARVRAA